MKSHSKLLKAVTEFVKREDKGGGVEQESLIDYLGEKGFTPFYAKQIIDDFLNYKIIKRVNVFGKERYSLEQFSTLNSLGLPEMYEDNKENFEASREISRELIEKANQLNIVTPPSPSIRVSILKTFFENLRSIQNEYFSKWDWAAFWSALLIALITLALTVWLHGKGKV